MTRLEYAQPPRRRDSAWSLVGFALALVSALFSAWSWWDLWRILRNAGGASFAVSPVYYGALGAFAAVCAVGLRRGRRRFAVAGLVLLIVSAAAMAALVAGSPWSAPRRVPPPAPRISQ